MQPSTVTPDEQGRRAEGSWSYVTDWTQRNTVSLALAVVATVNLVGLIFLF